MLLKDKNILVAVTASIAIYKSLELIRLYIKAGANVKVIMTDSSKKFIAPITFEAISQNKVLDEETESWDKDSDYNHIDIGKWADVFVIAPASANTINKFANGIADNLLTQTVLAYPNIKLIAPAANTNMLNNPITQESLNKLKVCNFKIVSSQVKELACKDVGDGAMAEPEEIFYTTARQLLKDDYWNSRKVVLSGGGTIEKIDDVRYVSNFSSGKMASSMALSLYLKGADVCLVSTRGYESLPKEINVIPVQSSAQMYENLVASIQIAKKDSKRKPFLFMIAAISDYLPTTPQDGKLKKDMLGSFWKLDLKQNIDILSSLDKDNLISIGFKAEMDETMALSNAQNMLEKKKLDGVCLNILDDKNSFGSDSNEIELILKENSYKFNGEKIKISCDILDTLKGEFKEYE
ncbi:bifunctional phosphopantothenoylcysteine decarboxylase/phosphopantothenate--cysteine ligase CoaBC [Arcobacter sp. LA11]|uniref:bifunctional phosphopantothenoylcysteine decarboxylase/phosphopantothenate--cysteine ligase CoaBC n=1 Tax=Arcobacter sp. LA11 TaxID=1898176 RepID=UPI000934A267|nr:bifunctional phosphopantothenoylcysteine decarboxylase/phosphopantothenate--cysteine ligase CoaBC [Arcobacter sp. LA11]